MDPHKIDYMSHNLNSFKGIIWGTIGVIKGDTRSSKTRAHVISRNDKSRKSAARLAKVQCAPFARAL